MLLVALSTLYLDVFRNRLSKERTQQTRIETATAAAALTHVAAGRMAGGSSRDDSKVDRRPLAALRPRMARC